VADRTFVKFTFFKLDPAWRRRDAGERARDKAEFQAACDDFAGGPLAASVFHGRHPRRRGPAAAQPEPDPEGIHTFHVVLGQSGLARWASTPYSYLAMTKPSPYSDSESRPEICTSDRRYLFVYPFDKKREWYGLPLEERQRIMANHIEVGRRYPEISINTAYSFGLDDQEFVVAFEGDDPGEFLDLVQELRGTESSSHAADTPIFTCVAMSPARALDARRHRRHGGCSHSRSSPATHPFASV
jgi:chlorite dismutase